MTATPYGAAVFFVGLLREFPCYFLRAKGSVIFSHDISVMIWVGKKPLLVAGGNK